MRFVSTAFGFAIAATAMFATLSTPAAANPAFAQSAGGAPCSTCHMPGQETSAPGAGFTQQGQSVYQAFQSQGTSCYQNINNAVSSVLSGTACMPVSQPGPNPYSQPAPYPQPAPYQQPAPYPQQQPSPYPAPGPYSQPAPYPQPAPYTQPAPYQQPYQQPYAQPAPYPQTQPFQQPGGPRLIKFSDSSCPFSQSYFVVRLGGDPNNVMRFYLKNSHSIRIHAFPGTTFVMACGGWPNENGNYSAAQ